MTEAPLRLTELSHGGGCGCKIAPAVLSEMLSHMPAAKPFANLMVGTETADDAAVWRLNDQQALIATTDFFMPPSQTPRNRPARVEAPPRAVDLSGFAPTFCPNLCL